MPDLPTGTVTFLFTDIEGSTRLWEQHPDAMAAALARHDALSAALIEQHRGILVKQRGEGDSLFAVFSRTVDAVAAAMELQRALCSEPWPTGTPLRVRIALHTGDTVPRDGDYFGAAVNRCARLRAVAHGGQVLLSQATGELVGQELPPGVSLCDLGMHRLRDLQQPEHLFQLIHPDLPAEFPPLRSLEAFSHNLPAQLTSFIGREQAIAEVKQFLVTTRLLTLTGSGGCGKTRLALQVAADLLEGYPDGVWLVELAPLSEPTLVPQRVASALGLREQPGRPLAETLMQYLKSKAPLLILDNCEHLLTACAQLADNLLRSSPKLCILASSREGLGITGERTYRVPSLSLPDPAHLLPVERLTDYEAVRLFIERAVLTQPTFAVTAQNASALAQVCQRLDGIPLAIELAAARVKALSVEKLNERLDDMFRLLTGGSRTALPRQQTLRALIDWSYDLLSEEEQTLLRCLSVFAGGCTLSASEAVCAGEGVEEWEVLDLLTSLVEKSLVLYEERGEEGRYRLLETVRQYARDRLLECGEAVDVRERHRDWFLALVEQAAPALRGPAQGEWMDRLEREHDNLRTALDWSAESAQATEELRLASALFGFWKVRSYLTEGRDRLSRALSRVEAASPTPLRAGALNAAGLLATDQSDYTAAHSLHEESLAICRELGDSRGIASGLNNLGNVAMEQGDDRAARAFYEESLEICRRLDDKRGTAWPLFNLGRVAREQEEHGVARALFEESLAIHRELGNQWGIALALDFLALEAKDQGEYERARALLEESVAISRAVGNRWGLPGSLNILGDLARCQEEYGVAQALYKESLAISREQAHKSRIVHSLEGLAALALAQGQLERAARLFAAVEALRNAMGTPLSPADRTKHDRSVAAVRAALGEKAFAAAWDEGRSMTLDSAVALALEEARDA